MSRVWGMRGSGAVCYSRGLLWGTGLRIRKKGPFGGQGLAGTGQLAAIAIGGHFVAHLNIYTIRLAGGREISLIVCTQWI